MTDIISSPRITCPPQTSTCLEINLFQIKKNYQILKKISKNTCGAVIKADGYGLGSGPISKILYQSHCRHFFVTTIDEGIELRKVYNLPKNAEIYIFNGFTKKTGHIFNTYKLTPILLSLEQIKRWSNFAKIQEKKLPAIIHIDTGMTRTGLYRTEQKYLYKNPNILNSLNIHYIISHLACANTPKNPYNIYQLKKFKQFIKYFPNFKSSLAASGGITLGNKYHFDLTRPGLGIYGAKSTLPECKLAMRFWTRIIKIQRIKKGSFIGYESSYKCDNTQYLATLSFGYADGWVRPKDKNIGLSLQGKQIPLRGFSSMDLLVADISKFPKGSVRIGDWVQLLGPNMPIKKIAKISNTTPYQILTSLRHGIHHRAYINE